MRCPFSTFLRLHGDHQCACAQKWCHFCILFQELSNKKIKALRPKMTKIASSFWSFLTFLHHGIEEVERHLLWKLHKKIERKSWSNVPPKLLACIRFLYEVVHKIDRLRMLNCAREIEFNFCTAWTIFMKLGTLVYHVHGYKSLPQIF